MLAGTVGSLVLDLHSLGVADGAGELGVGEAAVRPVLSLREQPQPLQPVPVLDTRFPAAHSR